MSLSYKDGGKVLGFLVFFAWMFVITYRSGQTIMNPVLAVFGWRLYEIGYKFAGGSGIEQTGVVLSSVLLAPRETHRQVPIQDIMIIKASKPDAGTA